VSISSFSVECHSVVLTVTSIILQSPLRSSRHHLSYDDCLEDKRENYQNFLCCVVYNSVRAVLKDDCQFRFSFCVSF